MLTPPIGWWKGSFKDDQGMGGVSLNQLYGDGLIWEEAIHSDDQTDQHSTVSFSFHTCHKCSPQLKMTT